MAASILQSNKVIGGAEQAGPRSFYVSWVEASKSGDQKAPVKCSDLFKEQLQALAEDGMGRPIEQVVASAPGQQVAGTPVVAGGDCDWTDFVALVSSQYAISNKLPDGEFAQVLRLLDEAGEEGASERAAWWTLIEPSHWELFRIGGYKLDQVVCCHPLNEAKSIDSTSAGRVRDISRAVGTMVTHDPATCPCCRRKG